MCAVFAGALLVVIAALAALAALAVVAWYGSTTSDLVSVTTSPKGVQTATWKLHHGGHRPNRPN
ncbi:hypothetical protein [Plantibacter sp. RU18]|uniref:hypothetical protein n=1 Tax=Plantibacter sp. RU18 TaxID=3158143 RepID=UPI003D363381